MALTRITKGVIKPNENYDTHNINSTGIITATKFDGPFDTLDVTGDVNFSGNVSIAGTLTYEDVTNVDSVGIITARDGIHVGAGVSVVGVGTFGSLDINGDIDVDGHTNLDNVSIVGVTTITGTLLDLNSNSANPAIVKLRTNTNACEIEGRKVGGENHLVLSSNNSTDHLVISSTSVDLPNDNQLLRIGANNELKIAQDGTHNITYMQNVGPLQLQTDDLRFYNYSTADLYFRALTNAGVSLYYDYSTYSTAKLATTATGVTIDGTAVAGGLDISGDIRHIDNTNTKIAFTNNQIDLQCAGSSRAYINNYGLYIASGFPLAFLASSGATPNIKSGGTNAQDLLFTTGTGNPTRLSITSGGKVGIGTDNPQKQLQILGDSDTCIRVTSSAGGAASLQLGDTSDTVKGAITFLNSDNSLRIRGHNNADRIVITSGGNVNIAGDYTQTSYVLSVTNTANTNLFRIKTANEGDYDLRFNIQNSESHMWHYGTDDFVIGNRYDRKLHFITNGQKRLTIHGSYVGINQTAPHTGLHINQDWVNSYGSISVEGSANVLVGLGLRSNGNYRGSLIWRDGSSGNYLDIATYGGAYPILFRPNGNERLRITSNGRVSINDGTRSADSASEGATLRVTGTPVTRNEYYSPHGQYFGAIGYTTDTHTKAWLAVDSHYAQSSAVSAGIFLSAFHQDAGGSACGYTIKNLKSDNSLVFSSVKTAASTGNPAVEEERVRISHTGFVQIGAGANGAEAPLHVTAENSQGINAIFGAKDFIVHNNYNYADANIALQGRDADDNDTGAGIQFTVRNTGDTNWLHGAITMDVSGNYIFKNGGAGTTVGTERLRITSNGDVKIGTGDPDGKLHLGDIGSGDIVAELTSGSPMFTYRNGSNAWFHAGKHPSDDAFVITQGANTTATELFRIASNGNVAIGGDTNNIPRNLWLYNGSNDPYFRIQRGTTSDINLGGIEIASSNGNGNNVIGTIYGRATGNSATTGIIIVKARDSSSGSTLHEPLRALGKTSSGCRLMSQGNAVCVFGRHHETGGADATGDAPTYNTVYEHSSSSYRTNGNGAFGGTFVVGGSSTTWYPVWFSQPTHQRTQEIYISKYVHNYSTWDGKLAFRASIDGTGYGAFAVQQRIHFFSYSSKQFVGKVVYTSHNNAYIVLWMLGGGRSYQWGTMGATGITVNVGDDGNTHNLGPGNSAEGPITSAVTIPVGYEKDMSTSGTHQQDGF